MVITLLVAGVVCGAAGTPFLRRALAPYLPAHLGRAAGIVGASVLGKRRQGDRLVLTLSAPRGRLFATFRYRVGEIDMLVREGDVVALGVPPTMSLVEDPKIVRVQAAATANR